MFTKYPKLIMIGCLLIGLLIGLWIGTDIKRNEVEYNNSTQHAIRSVSITINPKQEGELFDQLRKFADKWSYAILLAPIIPNGEDFRIGMWREDIKVIGLYPTDPGTLYIGFYYTNPAIPVPEQYFDDEINDLETFISEIPNAKFSVKN